ncbi:MAG TPA: transporter [Edaphobacter sp.]|nr:transporter [Edaphobacter sp.]
MRRLGSILCLLLVATAISSAASVSEEQLASNANVSPDAPVSVSAVRLLSIADYLASPIFDVNSPLGYPRDLHLYVPQTTTKTSSKTSKPSIERIKRATIDPSMVGYIDNAVVHSEVRVRFDAALNNKTPDRAEFFYAKCGCYGAIPSTNAAYDPRTPGPGPGIPQSVNFQQLYFYGEYAPRPHFSLFMQLPFRWLQPQSSPGSGQAFPNAGGFGDVQLGLKFAPLVSSRHYVTLQFKAYLPSGDAGIGLGTHHYSVEPSLLYYQHLSDRLAVEAEVGDTHPLGTSSGVPTASPHGFAGDVFFYGAGPSYQFIRDEKFSLAGVLEVVGWNVRSGYVTGPANPSTAGVNIVNIKVGPRLSIGAHHSVYFGYGRALTSQNWYLNIFRTEYRYSF